MKITILNGNPEPSSFDFYLSRLETSLENKHHEVTLVNLREINLSYCIGCFGCWVKTPGVCSAHDESCVMRRAVIQSEFTLWAAPLRMGFPSALLKKSLDKTIPLIHPYMVVDQGEAHHRKRYESYPRLGLLLEREQGTDAADLEIVTDIFSRIALNFKSRLEFSMTSDAPPGEVIENILDGSPTYLKIKRGLYPIIGERIQPPAHMTIFNGSPRGNMGNTPIMLQQFGGGFASVPGHTYDIHNLNRINDHEGYCRMLSNADSIWLGFPLYTDAMPGMVKAFMESMEPLLDRKENPPIGFLVQSGFPEALHSRYVERYLEKLASRLKSPYLGTIVKGGGEGVRMMPDERNAKLFSALRGLGRGMAQNGFLDQEMMKEVAGTERYSLLMGPVFRVFLRTSAASWYWDSQLKQNGVYEDRFAEPYLEGVEV